MSKLFYQLNIKDMLKELKTTSDGLTAAEAASRLKQHGLNKLPAGKQIAGISIFFNQFNNFLIFILLVALLVSILARETSDAVIIGLAIAANVIFGFIQEYKAHKAFSALQQMAKFQAKVLRDQTVKIMDVSRLVIGDIILLEAGDRVPADCRVIRSHVLKCSEAILTGESAPVEKSVTVIKTKQILAERTNLVFSGTSVVDGSGQTVVYATGRQTEIGKIASSLTDISNADTPLQLKLKQFSRYLGIIILIISGLVFVTGLWAGKDLKEMFLTSVAVAVSALPEGLVVAVTVILAVGMKRILKERALVRKLIAAETLGSTTVICTDKTGTITKGEMELDKILTYSNLEDETLDDEKRSAELVKALEIAALCNNAVLADQIKGSPTDASLLAAALHSGLNIPELQQRYPRVDELPFNSDRKLMATIHKLKDQPGHLILLVKGAPEKILPLCAPADHDLINKKIERLSADGFRLLIGAYKIIRKTEIEQPDWDFNQAITNLTFAAMYGLRDPIRPDIKKTLDLTRSAGIKTIMITGDHQLTAMAIAVEVGLIKPGDPVISGEQFSQMSDDELGTALYPNDESGEFGVKVFARVSAADKLRLVNILKDHGEIVAMTGDGVNDAPALVKADIGVALGSGTDVAKGASDIVLLDDNYAVLVKAIEEGRVIFDNIRKVVLYLLSDSFSEIILILIVLLIGAISMGAIDLPLPLTAAQILWINIITDGLPSFALTLEPKDRLVMSEPPRKSTDPILNQQMKFLIGLISAITGCLVFGIFLLFYLTSSLEMARTMAFAALGVDSLVYVFSVRSLKYSIFKQNFWRNYWLILAVLAGFAIQLTALYLPALRQFLRLSFIPLYLWSIIIAECLLLILVIEIVKAVYNRRRLF